MGFPPHADFHCSFFVYLFSPLQYSCTVNFSRFTLQKLQSLFVLLNSVRLPCSAWVLCPFPVVQKVPPGQNCADHTAQLIFFLRESQFCSVCCPLPINSCFTYFVQFSARGLVLYQYWIMARAEFSS